MTGQTWRQPVETAMKLHKTDKAHAELKPGSRNLSQRERTLLLLSDGTKTSSDLQPLFEGLGEQIIMRLLAEGYLETRAPQPPVTRPLPEKTMQAKPVKAQTPARRDAPDLSKTPVPVMSVDLFEGKRSMATTRMFLFDICDRMFARRDPVLAERFREALRQARDRETMLDAARLMIEEIESVAGHERADSISERIAMLMPAELVH